MLRHTKVSILSISIQHFIESIIKLRGDSVDLHLLSDNFILKVVNSQMKFADVHLGILRLCLRVLQPLVDDLYLFLEIQDMISQPILTAKVKVSPWYFSSL